MAIPKIARVVGTEAIGGSTRIMMSWAVLKDAVNFASLVSLNPSLMILSTVALW